MSDHQPQISAELFVVPTNGQYLVYAPRRQAAFVANSLVVNQLADLQAGVAAWDGPGAAELLEFLRRLEIVDGGDEPLPTTSFSGQPRPTAVTLFLTTACNLRCTYCYASAGDTPKRTMPLSVAQRGIDFIAANALELKRPGIEVAYHGGGEPSVHWSVLTESHAYARSRADQNELSLHSAMASNGVLTDAKIDWIVEHLDSVSLSFDGLPEVHDMHRLTVLGGPSADRVMHTMRRFDAAKFSYGVRLTVTREHIPPMAESIDFICRNFSPQRMQVEPAYQLGRWQDAPSAETADFIAGYRQAQSVARSYGREIQFSAARVGSLSNHFCGITQDNFCLTADGNVSACYETFLEQNDWSSVFHYGTFDSKQESYSFNLPVLQSLREQSVEHREFCTGCFARWTCGGDCYHKSLAVNGPGPFQGSDRCHIIRELTKDQILERITAAGGLFWHERPAEAAASHGKEFLV